MVRKIVKKGSTPSNHIDIHDRQTIPTNPQMDWEARGLYGLSHYPASTSFPPCPQESFERPWAPNTQLYNPMVPPWYVELVSVLSTLEVGLTPDAGKQPLLRFTTSPISHLWIGLPLLHGMVTAKLSPARSTGGHSIRTPVSVHHRTARLLATVATAKPPSTASCRAFALSARASSTPTPPASSGAPSTHKVMPMTLDRALKTLPM